MSPYADSSVTSPRARRTDAEQLVFGQALGQLTALQVPKTHSYREFRQPQRLSQSRVPHDRKRVGILAVQDCRYHFCGLRDVQHAAESLGISTGARGILVFLEVARWVVLLVEVIGRGVVGI